MKNCLTLKELTDSLVKICEKYPELLDNRVAIATECGYSGANIQAPLILYKSVKNDELNVNSIHLKTTDDVDFDSENFILWLE